jgi:hypothetical protein
MSKPLSKIAADALANLRVAGTEPIVIHRSIVQRDADGELETLAVLERKVGAGHAYRVIEGQEWWDAQTELEAKQSQASGGNGTVQ